MNKDLAKDEIVKLRREGKIRPGYRIMKDGDSVLIPVFESEEFAEFEERKNDNMEHVGSFDRIADFFIIRKREGWERILSEIIRKQKPRAVFLDHGVEGKLRIRNLKLVYGSGFPIGIHKENGFRYMVDLNKVYFSPRLSTLRRIIVGRITSSREKSLIVDMYAGVGPISIPLSKNGIRVVSVDINPDAIRLLRENSKLNHTSPEIILGDSYLLSYCWRNASQVVMNNPTQPLDITLDILNQFNKGVIVHLTHIESKDRPLTLHGWNVLEKVIVHGYSPSSSLVYYRLLKDND
ncbi:MAG: methyltransferase [Thermoplasmatales archaeon]